MFNILDYSAFIIPATIWFLLMLATLFFLIYLVRELFMFDRIVPSIVAVIIACIMPYSLLFSNPDNFHNKAFYYAYKLGIEGSQTWQPMSDKFYNTLSKSDQKDVLENIRTLTANDIAIINKYDLMNSDSYFTLDKIFINTLLSYYMLPILILFLLTGLFFYMQYFLFDKKKMLDSDIDYYQDIKMSLVKEIKELKYQKTSLAADEEKYQKLKSKVNLLEQKQKDLLSGDAAKEYDLLQEKIKQADQILADKNAEIERLNSLI